MDKKDLDCKQFEKQLFSTQKTENLGILAGRIGHDLNNLLTVIMGNIEILKFLPSIAGNPPQEISFISDAAAKAAELTHRMLRLSGRAASQSAFMNLNAIIEEYLPILWLALPKSIPIQTELSPDLPEIQIIRADIEQVLLNLVINSGEALQDKSGKVTISTGIKNMKAAEFAQSVLDEKPAAGKYIYFTVSDTGPGIESSVKDRVFDPFFTTKPQGRGLGLTVVQCIIRKYHGALFLEAPHGKATKITIMLPLLQPDSGESHEALQSIFKKDSGKRLSGTLIVADDEPIVLRILVKILQSTGLSILPAKNGLEVIELYMKHKGEIDGFVLDVTMPEKSGIECYQELRKIDPAVKVIIASGAGEIKNIKTMIDEGIFSYVPKPYTLEDLEREIVKLLATK